MLRHIAWFNEAPIEPHPAGGLISTDPVVCRRCLVPAREIEKLNIACSVFGNLGEADPVHVGKHLQKLGTDIVIIGHFSGASFLKLARVAKHLGCYVVADFSDAGTLTPDMVALARMADQSVCATSDAAAALEEQAHVSSVVIPDCDAKTTGKITHLWLECLNRLKCIPPVCANTNIPA